MKITNTQPKILQDYLVWAMIGVLIGARLGDVLIYNFSYFRATSAGNIFAF